MSSEGVNQIVQMMSENRLLKGDMSEAAVMFKAMLSEKYLAPIKKALEAEKRKARKNPSKEARLLDAIKPFMDAGRHEALEKTIDMLHMLETMRSLSNQAPKPIRAAAIERDPSVRDDGVYDIDEQCAALRRRPPLPPILVFMAALLNRG